MKKQLLRAVVGLILVVGCGRTEQAPQFAVIPPDAPDEESWNATLVFTDSSWTKARIRVGHARKYISRGQTLLDSGVYAEFYGRGGELDATLVADSAVVDDRTKDMVAYGSVHVESQRKQTTIDTDRLHYDNERRYFHSDAPVTIIDRAQGRTLRGVGFESDESLQNYTIYKPSGRFERME